MATQILTPDNVRALDTERGPSTGFEELSRIMAPPGRRVTSRSEVWTQTRYKAALRSIKQLKQDEPVTILNKNCFPLKINGGVFFPDEVAACPPGQPYTVHVIRDIRWGHTDKGCDQNGTLQMEPLPAIPLVLATEYIREYVQGDNRFGGVVCYVGDRDPASIPKGDTVMVPEIAFDESGEFYVKQVERDFHRTMEASTHLRNATIMRRLQSAQSWYENDAMRNYVTDPYRDMARLAHQEGLIPELPRWVMTQNLIQEKQADPCPSCMVIPKTGAILCVNCEHIFDVIAAFKNTRIAFGAVEMERLTADEWKIVNQIQAERQKAKGIKHKGADAQ